MENKYIENQLEIIQRTFDACTGGSKESTMAALGVDSFTALLNKAFSFFCYDSSLRKSKNGSNIAKIYFGTVIGIEFREYEEYNCRKIYPPVINTTVGKLFPPFDSHYWLLKIAEDYINGYVKFP